METVAYLRRPSSSAKPDAVTTSEIDKVLGDLKAGTAPGYDCIHPEFLTHMGPQARNWLAEFFSRLLVEHCIPRVWRQAKVIALPKPGKDITLAASYRPISLLSVCFKLLESIILRRIAPTVHAVLSSSQAGFRQGRSTSNQVCALTTFTENGFQQGLKTGAVFVDVTAAFDTVWHTGLLSKVSNVLPRWAVDMVALFLQNRRFRVHMGDQVSAWRGQSNGLPQGSILSPTLFNLYIDDLPETESRKFIYTDDIQARSFVDLEKGLNPDMAKLSEFCDKWRLTPSVTKTVSSVFHLDNRHAAQKLSIYLSGRRIKHDPHPCSLSGCLSGEITHIPSACHKDCCQN